MLSSERYRPTHSPTHTVHVLHTCPPPRGEGGDAARVPSVAEVGSIETFRISNVPGKKNLREVFNDVEEALLSYKQGPQQVDNALSRENGTIVCSSYR